MPFTEVPRDVPIALLYQQAALHEHLKRALADLGAQVVYDAPAATFDRAALNASGARVVVVNLDPEVEGELDHLYALLEDDTLNVIFNDAEVSSRLEGWDHARWARHLAAKILGLTDTNPPRPPGAEAVAVRVRAAGPERIGSNAPDRGFDLLGHEFDAALHADTAEALSRTRAALTTTEEPVRAELIDAADTLIDLPQRPSQPSMADAPTLELPRPPAHDDRPTLELPHIEAPAQTVPHETPAVTDVDADEFAALSIDFTVDEVAVTDNIVNTLDSDGDDLAAKLDDLGLDFDAPLGAVAEVPVAPARADGAVQAADDEFSQAFGALELAGFDDERAADQRDSAPPPGLDDLLRELQDVQAKAGPLGAPAAKPDRQVEPVTKPLRGSAKPDFSLADDHAPPAPASVPAAAVRDLSRFDLSHLALAPIDDDDSAKALPAHTDGRAQYRIDTADRAAPAAPLPPASPAPHVGAAADEEFDFGALEFEPADSPAGVSAAKYDEGADVFDFGAAELSNAEFSTAPTDADPFADFGALLAADTAAPASAAGATLRCWVLGASIGGPEAVRDFLARIPANAGVVFLLAQHMGAEFVDLMTQQLARATPLSVRAAQDGMRAAPGEVIVVPLTERLLLSPDGRVRVVASAEASPYSPSIDQVMRDVADRFGADAGAIIFSGMAHDAIEGARYLHERGGQVWAQDPSTCVISSMVDGACEAGVVSVLGAPSELARRFVADVLGRA